MEHGGGWRDGGTYTGAGCWLSFLGAFPDMAVGNCGLNCGLSSGRTVVRDVRRLLVIWNEENFDERFGD